MAMMARKPKEAKLSDIDRYRNGGAMPTAEKAQSQNLDDLDKYYGGGTVLDETYRRAQEQLDQSRRTAKQSAYTAYDTAMKYLPIQNKMNGLAGLGVSESGAIDAYNRLLTSMGGIDQTHASDSAALLERYREAAAAEQEKEETKLKTAQDAVYTRAMDMFEKYQFNSAADIDEYLEIVRGRVSDDQWAHLEAYADYYKADPANKLIFEENEKQAAADKVAAELNAVKNSPVSLYAKNGKFWGHTDYRANDNFEIIDKESGTVYDVESRGEETDETVLANAAAVLPDSVFAFGGKIYYKAQNGTVYRVGGRGNKENGQYGDYDELYALFYPNEKDVENVANDFITMSRIQYANRKKNNGK